MRDTDLARFLMACETALRRCHGPALAVAEAVVGRWQAPGPRGSETPATLPVCSHADAALRHHDTGLGQALAPLLPRLAWARRPSARPTDAAFYDGHANAMLLGPGGLEDRSDLWLGITVMAPGTVYPDHSHPPAEVYLPLTPGEWRNAGMDWTDPGLGGFIHNPPAILHAMRSGTGPFLAIWALPL